MSQTTRVRGCHRTRHCSSGVRATVQSPAFVKHEEVMRQGLSMILSIIYALTEGTTPRWGEVQVGSNDVDEPAASAYLAELRTRDTAAAVLTGVNLTSEVARLTGHAFLPGAAAPEESGNDGPRETKQLVLVRDGEAWVADADTVPVDQLYLKYFEKHFVSYADGGFACDAKELFDSLPEGVYDAFARVTSDSEDIDRRSPSSPSTRSTAEAPPMASRSSSRATRSASR
ncbi:hypothetical protein ACIF9R_29505 [Streptomyces sp. NPDC086080]|uniref:hypothetical protein n=1 Tax=Streptomyces sp. NPDC086080 TaxID=3365748 RepID=UPI0037D87D11